LLGLIKENIDEIAESVVINHGKEWNAAVGEVIRAYQMIEASFAVPEYQKGQYMPNIAMGIDEYSILEPLGAFIMIPPFNFPAMIPFWFWPFAVAAGNTYIIKSNEQTPLAFQNIFKFIDQAGFPPGVINFIHGDVEIANHLIEHPDVVGVSSVGSTPVAQEIYKKTSSLCKRAQCHGGANNFLVITEKANIEHIMPNIMNSVFGNSGQRCLSGAVLMVVGKKSFYDNFKAHLLKATNELKIGYGMDKETFMGPIISKKSLSKLHKQIQSGIDEGAELILDGRGIKVPGYEKGYFLGPCFFEKAKPGMKIYDEEVFGPVGCLDHVDTLKEAIKIINQNPKGNAVTIYTESGEPRVVANIYNLEPAIAKPGEDFVTIYGKHLYGDSNQKKERTGMVAINHKPIMLDKSDREQVEKAQIVKEKLFRKVIAISGTLSGEHGVGITKAAYITKEIGSVELNLMKKIKKIFDPNGILNPGKIFPD